MKDIERFKEFKYEVEEIYQKNSEDILIRSRIQYQIENLSDI